MSALAVIEVDPITEAQRTLWPYSIIPRTRREFRRIGRWWDLEAMRGYPSSTDSRRYAANMFRRADLRSLVAARGGELFVTEGAA